VVFGHMGKWPAALDLANLDGSDGFALNGIDTNDLFGSSVSSAGDINGDGIDDLVIGAPGEILVDPGESYVVFGHSGMWPAVLDLASLDGNGFVLNGIDPGDGCGLSVSSAGDINGDRIDDLVIGAPRAGEFGEGESYVVFGHTGVWPAALDLASLDASNGFMFKGVSPDDFSGSSVLAADFNHDGLGDIVIGAILADPFGAGSAGEIYVIFGQVGPWPAVFELSRLLPPSVENGLGFVLQGVHADGFLGHSISAGDVNGDDIDDVAIGAPFHFGTGPGKSYIVFGKRSWDCNANDVLDECDISDGVADDNNNGIPDECE